MYTDLIEQENQLRKEADIILYDKRIKSTLAKYGKVQVQGSYYLQLITWRDLDFYVQRMECLLVIALTWQKNLRQH